ncbi:DUF6911 family protein [Commensalibacter nepenthis]|uniref:Uncharacterized protein n=1 Tax=Commensalibacter nepenthis TaxID=3043872 RepID=A0ABT6Q4V3_9PROT|nr:hypothetical protein [Commensalibacter sp. TBRC 10068]MDI2111772.1 hypothetical protein [Commensalibacter sp. TBRC 10068]
MNIKFRLGGYYLQGCDEIRTQLPLINQPSITELMNHLTVLKIRDGVLGLGNDQEENHKPYELRLYSDNHNYLVMMETILPDGDIDIRTFRNPSALDEFTSMLGEPYGAWSIVQNFDLVIKAFKEFLETGDVSRDLLS